MAYHLLPIIFLCMGTRAMNILYRAAANKRNLLRFCFVLLVRLVRFLASGAMRFINRAAANKRHLLPLLLLLLLLLTMRAMWILNRAAVKIHRFNKHVLVYRALYSCRKLLDPFRV